MSNKFLNEVNQSEDGKAESFKKEKFEVIKPDRTKYIILASIILVALVGFFILNNTKVTMENFDGWTINDAQSWANSNDIQLIVKEVYSDIKTQTIVSQSIEEGKEVKPKSSIEIEVSQGFDPKEIIVLPKFDETWTKEKILTWIEENGIVNYTFLTVEDSEQSVNSLVDYETPETLESFIREHKIEFTVSILPVEAEIVVVDMLNYTTAQIDAWVRDNDLKVIYRTAFSDTVATNKVLTQSVSAGDVINPNDSITVTLSKGVAIKMADFTSYDQTSATNWAKDNGVDLIIKTSYSNTVAKGVAIYQSIPFGVLVETGSDLTILYSLGNEISLSSFVNQAYINLQSFVETQNALGANLILTSSTSYSPSVTINKVISQNYQDTKIQIGTTINVIVSLGDLSTVPDLLSLNIDKVFGLNEDLTPKGITPIEMYELVSSRCSSSDIVCQIVFIDDNTNYGLVLEQSVSAGIEVSDTTVIQVKIAN
jgi:beta-lactam-binding protein with PASTA domain